MSLSSLHFGNARPAHPAPSSGTASSAPLPASPPSSKTESVHHRRNSANAPLSASSSSALSTSESLFSTWEKLEQLFKQLILHIPSVTAKLTQILGPLVAQVKERLILAWGQVYDGPLSEKLYSQVERHALFAPVGPASLQAMSPELRAAIKRTILFPVPELGGIELSAWHLPAQPGKPTILYLHGRRHNISHLGPLFQAFKDSGFGFFAPDYPGFGRSEGNPQIKTIHHAARAAQNELIRRGVPINQQILMGHSLGSAIAIDHIGRLSPDEKPMAVVLINSLTRMKDVVQSKAGEYRAFNWIIRRYPNLTQRFPELQTFFDLQHRVQQVVERDIPLLVLHSKADKVFHEQLGRDLHASAQATRQKPAVEGKSTGTAPIEFASLNGGHGLRKPALCNQVAEQVEAFVAALPTESGFRRFFRL